MNINYKKLCGNVFFGIATCIGMVLGKYYASQMLFPVAGSVVAYYIMKRVMKEVEWGVITSFAILIGMLLAGIGGGIFSGLLLTVLANTFIDILFVLGSLIWYLYKRNKWSLGFLLLFELVVLLKNFTVISIFSPETAEYQVMVVGICFKSIAILGLFSAIFSNPKSLVQAFRLFLVGVVTEPMKTVLKAFLVWSGIFLILGIVQNEYLFGENGVVPIYFISLGILLCLCFGSYLIYRYKRILWDKDFLIKVALILFIIFLLTRMLGSHN